MTVVLVEEEDVLRLLLGFMHSRGYYKALCALERETGVSTEPLDAVRLNS